MKQIKLFNNVSMYMAYRHYLFAEASRHHQYLLNSDSLKLMQIIKEHLKNETN